MLARLGIRLVSSLVGIAIGIVFSVALLSGFSATAHAILVSTLVFWAVHIVVNFIALRILIRQPSVATAGLLALAVVVGLVVVIASGGGGTAEASTCDNAHIKNSGGTFRGLDPDCREGTPPPTIKRVFPNRRGRSNCVQTSV